MAIAPAPPGQRMGAQSGGLQARRVHRARHFFSSNRQAAEYEGAVIGRRMRIDAAPDIGGGELRQRLRCSSSGPTASPLSRIRVLGRPSSAKQQHQGVRRRDPRTNVAEREWVIAKLADEDRTWLVRSPLARNVSRSRCRRHRRGRIGKDERTVRPTCRERKSYRVRRRSEHRRWMLFPKNAVVPAPSETGIAGSQRSPAPSVQDDIVIAVAGVDRAAHHADALAESSSDTAPDVDGCCRSRRNQDRATVPLRMHARG